mmetsp:Transcript_9660/g.18273  ORF Transcript_9660/g.18273 Transcript_9660/m.18273 type:complete len:289 (+) Transcript_9660:114-980(+)
MVLRRKEQTPAIRRRRRSRRKQRLLQVRKEARRRRRRRRRLLRRGLLLPDVRRRPNHLQPRGGLRGTVRVHELRGGDVRDLFLRLRANHGPYVLRRKLHGGVQLVHLVRHEPRHVCRRSRRFPSPSLPVVSVRQRHRGQRGAVRHRRVVVRLHGMRIGRGLLRLRGPHADSVRQLRPPQGSEVRGSMRLGPLRHGGDTAGADALVLQGQRHRCGPERKLPARGRGLYFRNPGRERLGVHRQQRRVVHHGLHPLLPEGSRREGSDSGPRGERGGRRHAHERRQVVEPRI